MELNLHTTKRNYTERFSNASAFYIANNGLSRKGNAQYKLVTRKWIEACGDKFFNQYTERDNLLFINSLTVRNLAQNTKANYTRHLSVMFNWFIKYKFAEKNIIDKAKRVKTNVKIIPKEDLEEIFIHFQQRNKTHYELFKFTYLMAFRISETLNIKTEQFDLENNIVYVDNTKGKRIDVIPLPQDAREFFLAMNKPVSGRIFAWKNYDAIKGIWQRMNESLNFNYNIHQLRKTRGSDLANRGVKPLFLQNFMRHTDSRVTQEYYVLIDLRKATKDIDAALKDDEPDDKI